MQLLQFQLRGKTVLMLIDNSTAVAYIRNQGGTRSRALLKLTGRILLLADQLQIQLIPRHITGQLNVLADLASIINQVVPSEWSLCAAPFQWISLMSPWGYPMVDIFANRLSHRLTRYMSPCQDDQAEAIDALTAPWPNKVIYAYPPLCLLQHLLSRCQRQKGFRMLLVSQWTPHAKWTSLLNTLDIRLAADVPVNGPLVRQPHWNTCTQVLEI